MASLKISAGTPRRITKTELEVKGFLHNLCPIFRIALFIRFYVILEIQFSLVVDAARR
jgi:hypothetical protein